MRRKFSISQLSTIISECEAATVRDFLCHFSASPTGNALKNFDQTERALEPEKRILDLQETLKIADKVMLQKGAAPCAAGGNG